MAKARALCIIKSIDFSDVSKLVGRSLEQQGYSKESITEATDFVINKLGEEKVEKLIEDVVNNNTDYAKNTANTYIDGISIDNFQVVVTSQVSDYEAAPSYIQIIVDMNINDLDATFRQYFSDNSTTSRFYRFGTRIVKILMGGVSGVIDKFAQLLNSDSFQNSIKSCVENTIKKVAEVKVKIAGIHFIDLP